MHASPYPCALPITPAPPARHAAPAAQLLRDHLPGDTTFQDKDDAGERGAVRDAAWASTFGLGRLRWQDRRDDLPQPVADQWCTHAANLPHGMGCVKRTY